MATITELLCMHREHEKHLHHIHLSASWMSLGRLMRQSPAEQWRLKGNAESLELLVQEVVRAVVARESDARGLANIAYAAASAFATMGQVDAQLFTALAREAERRVWYFNAQGLANTAWAFATLGQLDAKLFMALARAAERCVGNFTTHGLANTAWAFATLGQPDAQLFTALANEAQRRVGDFNPQELANTA